MFRERLKEVSLFNWIAANQVLSAVELPKSTYPKIATTAADIENQVVLENKGFVTKMFFFSFANAIFDKIESVKSIEGFSKPTSLIDFLIKLSNSLFSSIAAKNFWF